MGVLEQKFQGRFKSHARNSIRRYVSPSVGRSVGLFTSSFWSCISVSRLAETFTAPAQPHATDVAVYTALLIWRTHTSIKTIATPASTRIILLKNCFPASSAEVSLQSPLMTYVSAFAMPQRLWDWKHCRLHVSVIRESELSLEIFSDLLRFRANIKSVRAKIL